ncbi:hypothetical protein [Candidatus Methanomassiliicoccus intestinalis]|uniref:hypothetical protein n=1 Tax=Candidatus Methanomassiliicoccus intestinalis TaxID=1406512 RepID=UPI0037DC261D
MMLAVPIAASSDSWDTNDSDYNDFILSVDGSQSDPYTINMLAGDQYTYTITTNLPSAYSVTSGDLSSIGFSFSTNVISGTATEGKEKICITATSTEGPTQTKNQWIQFNVYNVLALSGSITQNSWANTAYSSIINVTDVDPDASGEVSLTLNAAATTAGYTITKVNETSWTLARDAIKATAGSTEVVVTATTAAGGVNQSKTLSATVTTYSTVGFTSTPSGHDGSGTTVWLIEGSGSWTYTPVATPSGSTITASTLSHGITFANGVLTVPKSTVFDATEITLTASSSSGGSSQTATQKLTVRVWSELEFLSSPSIADITHTVDGRTYTFSVQAANYNSIIWDINGDVVDDNNSETLTYNFKNSDVGTYTVRATAVDEIGRTATATTTVLLEEGTDPAPVDPDTKDDDYLQFIKDNQKAIIVLVIGIILAIIGLIKNDEEYGIVLIVIGVVIAVIALLFISGTLSVDSIQEWFTGLKGGSK